MQKCRYSSGKIQYFWKIFVLNLNFQLSDPRVFALGLIVFSCWLTCRSAVWLRDLWKSCISMEAWCCHKLSSLFPKKGRSSLFHHENCEQNFDKNGKRVQRQTWATPMQAIKTPELNPPCCRSKSWIKPLDPFQWSFYPATAPYWPDQCTGNVETKRVNMCSLNDDEEKKNCRTPKRTFWSENCGQTSRVLICSNTSV